MIGHFDIENTTRRTIQRDINEFVFIGSTGDVFQRFMYRYLVGN